MRWQNQAMATCALFALFTHQATLSKQIRLHDNFNARGRALLCLVREQPFLSRPGSDQKTIF
jgi:hypothetical protein